MSDLASMFAANAPYVAPGQHNFNTELGPLDELKFRSWVQSNSVPFNPNAGVTDYDMRGFWRGMQREMPQAAAGQNENDGQLHYSDYWKTPYHKTFSAESQWAAPVAPQWNAQDQLVAPSGRILFDERAKPSLADMFRGR